MAKKKVVVIGAGLAGSLLSIYLARRGIAVEVYESRGDMRLEEMSAGRSINLALSDRGIAALREVGMDEYMLREAVPMLGRMIHDVQGQKKLLPYSGRKGEYINSISRGGLNIALINEAENYDGSRFQFNRRCVGFDCSTGEALIENTETRERFKVKGDTLIATDGAGSAVRQSMMNGGVERFNYSQDFLEHGYKELSIPPRSGPSTVADGLSPPARDVTDLAGRVQPPATAGGSDRFLMEKNALHIWARHQFMMIALPNFDGSFTCTLFLAHKGETSFESIVGTATGRDRLFDNPHGNLHNDRPPVTAGGSDTLIEFFERHFPDALPLMRDLEEEFFKNPTGNLGTVKCYPWNVRGKALLLGDSAHAMVPFYGQGMNCSFEDCRVLDALIEQHGTDWEAVFNEFSEVRKPNADAICDLAVENFYEMRDAVADPVFQKKRELETILEQTYPGYFSKYSMVTFREDLPYTVAKRQGNAQDELLMEICSKVPSVGEIDLAEVFSRVKSI